MRSPIGHIQTSNEGEHARCTLGVVLERDNKRYPPCLALKVSGTFSAGSSMG
jgi:hypothetical protein